MTDTTTRARALLEAATPLPWRTDDDSDIVASVPSKRHKAGVTDKHVVCFGHDYDEYGRVSDEDAALIVAAVNAYPDLLDVAEALERAGQKQPEALEAFRRRGIAFTTDVGEPWEQRTEAEQWEAVAFSLYTDLCEINRDAEAALSKLRESE